VIQFNTICFYNLVGLEASVGHVVEIMPRPTHQTVLDD